MAPVQQPTRRALLRGVSWAVPTAAAAVAAPAVAASSPEVYSGGEYGLFVSTQYNGGYVGYSNSNDSVARVSAKTPSAYFSASPRPESDISWNDAGTCRTNSSLYVNGEGSFTPVTNSASGAAGSYGSASGFWWSVPTTSPGTGSGYISSSTATLKSGATFVTQVEVLIPAGSNASWTANNIRVAGSTWTKALSGTLDSKTATATYLSVGAVAGTWSITAPTITTLSSGAYRVTGTITFTTTADAKVTQSGTKYYGQAIIMPATLQVNPSYGWTSVSLTSYVKSATIAYTGQKTGMPSSTTLTDRLTTTSTLLNDAC